MIGTDVDPTGAGSSIFVWDEQQGSGDPDGNPQMRGGFIQSSPSYAVNVSVGPNGDPWIVDALGHIRKTIK